MKMNWNKLATLAFCAAAMSAGAAHAADIKEIRFGVEASYAPFESKSPGGELQGFDVDVGNAVCAKLKAKCVWVENSFDGLIPALAARKFNAINSDMTITDQRRQAIDFTDPIYAIPNQMIAKKGSTLQPTPESLKGKHVGVLPRGPVGLYLFVAWRRAAMRSSAPAHPASNGRPGVSKSTTTGA